MKFTVNRTELLNALTIAGKGKSTNIVFPILENYLFKITKTHIEIIGSNQEIYISKTIEASSDTENNISVPDIRELISKLPEQPIIFEIDNLDFVVKWNGGSAKLVCEDGNLFPPIKMGKCEPIAIDGLAEALNKTVFCISNNTNTPFDGLSIDISPNSCVLTAYGNNTLSTRKIACGALKATKLLLPKNTADKLLGLEITQIAYDKNAIDFIIDDTLFIRSVLLDMKFPDFKDKCELNQDKNLQINADALRNSAEIVKLMANKFSQFIGIYLGENSFVKGSDKDFSTEGKQLVDGIYTGDDFIIGCNGQFLINALSKFSGDIFLYFSEIDKPIVIRENDDNSTLDDLMIVMPISI